ncbi:MAG: DUF695 domain-containing protein [Planctomycetes bacterium]|nr:DUF695 domain-containing protein [Planctomycetota bacterium]
MNPVLKMIEGDKARVVKLTLQDGVALIRFRTPVLGGVDMPGYHWRLVVLWAYAEDGSGELPSPEASEAMDVFEERICEAWGHDNHAVWVAVLTFDGARRWVFYTSDVEECGRRLAEMPQEQEPYPIEVEAEEDPKWLYLREQILGHVDF